MEYIDKHVQAFLPNEHEDPELYDLVKMYQKHSHSKTCRKHKNVNCHFNFGQFFSKHTIVAENLDEDMDNEFRNWVLTKRTEVLSSVKQKIDEVLNPSKDTYDNTLTESDILNSIGISEDEYYRELSISPD